VRVAVAAAKTLIKAFDAILLVGSANRRIFPAGRWFIDGTLFPYVGSFFALRGEKRTYKE
jgi:hypothetical protein